MNYSNTPLRPDRSAPAPQRGPETVLSLETDKRGTHLRVRKLDTLRRRARSSFTMTASLVVFGLSAQAQFIIDQTTSLFSPSFRDTLTLDAGNTTWFGWTGNNDGVAPSADDSGFDGSNANELIDNPTVIVGVGGLDGALNQMGNADILAGSNNLFVGDFVNGSFEAHLTLQIPTNGTPGLDGFTTIILQGMEGVTGNDTQVAAVPGTINGINPSYVSGFNATGSPQRLQWWAKYEIPGNAESYTVDITLAGGAGINPNNLRELVVDTQFSTTAYASDTAAVPEPSAVALLGGIGVFYLARRKR